MVYEMSVAGLKLPHSSVAYRGNIVKTTHRRTNPWKWCLTGWWHPCIIQNFNTKHMHTLTHMDMARDVHMGGTQMYKHTIFHLVACMVTEICAKCCSIDNSSYNAEPKIIFIKLLLAALAKIP